MESYNVMVFFTGEGSVNIYLPKIGETLICAGKPIYIKDANIKVIEALRSYRRGLHIDIKIGAPSKGAYRTIDYSQISAPVRQYATERKEVADIGGSIGNILASGSNGPIPLEDIKPSTTKDTVDYGEVKITSGTWIGKTIKEADEAGRLDTIYKKTHNEDLKNSIENYYKNKLK